MQVNKGIKYLMSYAVQDGEQIAPIAIKFGADVGQTFEANEKTEQDADIKAFTTLLVPLPSPPNGSQIKFPPPISTLPSPPSASPAASTPSSTLSRGGSSKKKWVYLGVGIIAGAAVVLIAEIIRLCVLSMTRRKKADPNVSSQSFEAQENALLQQTETEPLEFLKNITDASSLQVYSFRDLQIATENFSSDYWIQGSVYKGILDGTQAAIKKMTGDVSQEISILNKINHFNLISLLGVCFNHGTWYLVYEYAVKGPLTDWIYHEEHDNTLSWARRMQISSDVATGLNYLHSYTSPPHVHKDKNSSNILLDGDFRAKIAKIGLSKPVRGNDGQYTLTKHIVGTKGYLAPEFLENGLVTQKLDVYSFGVLLLEMLTGKAVTSLYEGVKVHLSEVLDPLLSEEDGNLPKLKAFIDPSLGEDYPENVALAMIRLVDQCLRKDPGSRPSMDEIGQILSKTLTTSLIWGSTSVSTTTSVKSSLL